MSTVALSLLTLLARGPHPLAAPLQGLDLRCIVLSQRETAFRRGHLFACTTGAGTVLGALLHRNGTIACPLNGVFDEWGCLTIVFCGVEQRACAGGG